MISHTSATEYTMPDSMMMTSTRQYRKLADPPPRRNMYLIVVGQAELRLGARRGLTHHTRSAIKTDTVTFVASDRLKSEPFQTCRMCANALCSFFARAK